MADIQNINPENAPGRFYVDDSCIDCDMCRESAPDFFRRVDENSYSVVWHQPATAEQIAMAIQARDGCPTESIGSDGGNFRNSKVEC